MRLLGLDRYAAIGLLHVLWYWALDYADDGDLSACSDEDIADGVRWERDAGELVTALTTAGFLDADRTLHDWYEFAGRLVERRRANVERTKRWRAEREHVTNAPVMHNEHVRYDATVPKPNRTGPDSTGTGDEGARSAADAAPKRRAVPKKPPGPNLGPLVEAFTAAGLPTPSFERGESTAAQSLLARYPPEEIAACWQDCASGEYGNDYSKRELSFAFLAGGQRFANWQRWKAQPATARAPNSTPKSGRPYGMRQESTTAELIVDARRNNISVDSDEELADRPALLAEVKRLEANGWRH